MAKQVITAATNTLIGGQKIHYFEADYGSSFASPPTDFAFLAEGDQAVYRNTKSGQSDATRLYTKLDGHVFYVALTFVA
jgi:hypothetical protein